MKTFTALAGVAVAIASVDSATAEDITNYTMADFGLGNPGSILQPLECLACGKAISWFDGVVQSASLQYYLLDDILAAVCLLPAIPFTPKKQCRQVAIQYGTAALDALSKHFLTKNRVCNEMLGMCQHPKITSIDLEQTVNDILADKPAEIQDDNYINNLYAQIAADTSDRAVIKAVQISDVHIDMEYRPGTKEDCGLAGCCRFGAGFPKPGEPSPLNRKHGQLFHVHDIPYQCNLRPLRMVREKRAAMGVTFPSRGGHWCVLLYELGG